MATPTARKAKRGKGKAAEPKFFTPKAAIDWVKQGKRIIIDPSRCPSIANAFNGDYTFNPKTLGKGEDPANDPDEPLSSQICRYALEGLKFDTDPFGERLHGKRKGKAKNRKGRTAR